MSMTRGSKYRTAAAHLALPALLVLLPGCQRISQHFYVHEYDGEINKAESELASAQNDSQRAAAYAHRGGAIGEKARYLRAFKRITAEEHTRLLDQALKDHAQAIALSPASAEMYFQRGRTVYMQSTLAPMVPEEAPQTLPRLVAAKADFSKAIELDPRHAGAYEFRGMTDEGTDDWDQAISDYTQLAALDPKSRFRLADGYCGRGNFYLKHKKPELAAPELEKSIDIGTPSDPCDCDPYNALIALYIYQMPDLEKARAVARRAKAAKKWIAPEYLEKLK